MVSELLGTSAVPVASAKSKDVQQSLRQSLDGNILCFILANGRTSNSLEVIKMSEIIQASAVQFLIDGGEEDAASVLLSCSLESEQSGDTWFVGDETHYATHISLRCPRAAYDILQDLEHPITKAIHKAINAVVPEDEYVKHFTIHGELVEIDPNWRTELLEIARGKGIHNQAVEAKSARIWKNLRFRSESEVRMAQAFDKVQGVLFLPNCKARLGTNSRENREADFLVCYVGKWGILEVDGEPFHPPSRTVEDHERDRLFRSHGIPVVEHFDASECYKNPDSVVKKFLDILKQAR